MTKDEIKALILEVIAEGIELDIPDDEIARVVTAETAGIVRRLDALESAGKPATAPKAEPVKPAAVTTTAAKPARVDVLRARGAALQRTKENRAEARNA